MRRVSGASPTRRPARRCTLSAGEKPAVSAKDAALQKRLRLIGVCVLFIGLSAAALVKGAAVAADDNALADTKRYEYQMELIGGKSNELAFEIREWFTGLWHGAGLAHTLAFISIITSVACFYVAHRLGYPAPASADTAGRDA